MPIEEQPDLLETAGPACRSAAWYWLSRGLHQMADPAPGETPAERRADFEVITRAINCGLIGLVDRLAYWGLGLAVAPWPIGPGSTVADPESDTELGKGSGHIAGALVGEDLTDLVALAGN